MSALQEAPCGHKGVSVDHFCFGQVHFVTCGPYVLGQSRISHILVLKCMPVFSEIVLHALTRLSGIRFGDSEQLGDYVHDFRVLDHSYMVHRVD